MRTWGRKGLLQSGYRGCTWHSTVMKEEVKENKAKVAKMEVAYKEGLKMDEELKKTKDTLAVKSAIFTRR